MDAPVPLNLYEADFYAWTQEQARLLHNRQWHQIDLPHLIEEISRSARLNIRS